MLLPTDAQDMQAYEALQNSRQLQAQRNADQHCIWHGPQLRRVSEQIHECMIQEAPRRVTTAQSAKNSHPQEALAHIYSLDWQIVD